jgi:mono/diheme cytochrome c family protein
MPVYEYDQVDDPAAATHHLKVAVFLAAILLLALCTPSASAQAYEAYRGQMLYESTCTECHTESVHSRPKRVARSLDEVSGFVRRWSLAAGKSWTDQDIRDVTVYLNQHHYHFSCAAPYCKREAARAPDRNTGLINALANTP